MIETLTAEERLHKIRQTSNVIQALDNLINQTMGEWDFINIKLLAEKQVEQLRSRLFNLTHYDESNWLTVYLLRQDL